MKPVLLFAPTAVPAIHLAVFERAFFPVYVLFEGVHVEEGEDFAACVVGPKGGHYFFAHRAGVAKSERKLIFTVIVID